MFSQRAFPGGSSRSRLISASSSVRSLLRVDEMSTLGIFFSCFYGREITIHAIFAFLFRVSSPPRVSILVLHMCIIDVFFKSLQISRRLWNLEIYLSRDCLFFDRIRSLALSRFYMYYRHRGRHFYHHFRINFRADFAKERAFCVDYVFLYLAARSGQSFLLLDLQTCKTSIFIKDHFSIIVLRSLARSRNTTWQSIFSIFFFDAVLWVTAIFYLESFKLHVI